MTQFRASLEWPYEELQFWLNISEVKLICSLKAKAAIISLNRLYFNGFSICHVTLKEPTHSKMNKYLSLDFHLVPAALYEHTKQQLNTGWFLEWLDGYFDRTPTLSSLEYFRSQLDYLTPLLSSTVM